MLKNFKLKKIVGKFFKSRSQPAEAKEINPSRDWNIILTFFTLLVFVAMAFSLYMYLRINSGSFFITAGEAESSVETIDRAKLKKVTEYYEAKNKLFQEAKTKKPNAVDPSL